MASSTMTRVGCRIENILQKDCNKICADCASPNPQWASLLLLELDHDDKSGSGTSSDRNTGEGVSLFEGLGAVICQKCAIQHHFHLGDKKRTFIKFLGYAHEWSHSELDILEYGGNDLISIVYETKLSTHNLTRKDPDQQGKFIHDKYKICRFMDPEAKKEAIELVTARTEIAIKARNNPPSSPPPAVTHNNKQPNTKLSSEAEAQTTTAATSTGESSSKFYLSNHHKSFFFDSSRHSRSCTTSTASRELYYDDDGVSIYTTDDDDQGYWNRPNSNCAVSIASSKRSFFSRRSRSFESVYTTDDDHDHHYHRPYNYHNCGGGGVSLASSKRSFFSSRRSRSFDTTTDCSEHHHVVFSGISIASSRRSFFSRSKSFQSQEDFDDFEVASGLSKYYPSDYGCGISVASSTRHSFISRSRSFGSVYTTDDDIDDYHSNVHHYNNYCSGAGTGTGTGAAISVASSKRSLRSFGTTDSEQQAAAQSGGMSVASSTRRSFISRSRSFQSQRDEENTTAGGGGGGSKYYLSDYYRDRDNNNNHTTTTMSRRDSCNYSVATKSLCSELNDSSLFSLCDIQADNEDFFLNCARRTSSTTSLPTLLSCDFQNSSHNDDDNDNNKPSSPRRTRHSWQPISRRSSSTNDLQHLHHHHHIPGSIGGDGACTTNGRSEDSERDHHTIDGSTESSEVLWGPQGMSLLGRLIEEERQLGGGGTSSANPRASQHTGAAAANKEHCPKEDVLFTSSSSAYRSDLGGGRGSNYGRPRNIKKTRKNNRVAAQKKDVGNQKKKSSCHDHHDSIPRLQRLHSTSLELDHDTSEEELWGPSGMSFLDRLIQEERERGINGEEQTGNLNSEEEQIEDTSSLASDKNLSSLMAQSSTKIANDHDGSDPPRSTAIKTSSKITSCAA